KHGCSIIAIALSPEEHNLRVCPINQFFSHELANIILNLTSIQTAVPHTCVLIGLINDFFDGIWPVFTIDSIENGVDHESLSKLGFSFSFSHGNHSNEFYLFLSYVKLRFFHFFN